MVLLPSNTRSRARASSAICNPQNPQEKLHRYVRDRLQSDAAFPWAGADKDIQAVLAAKLRAGLRLEKFLFLNEVQSLVGAPAEVVETHVGRLLLSVEHQWCSSQASWRTCSRPQRRCPQWKSFAMRC